MVALARWFRNSLLGALFIGFGTAFVQATRFAIKELFGSAVEDWLSDRLGQITGLEQAPVLATAAIVAVPAVVFAAGVYGAVLVTRSPTRRAMLADRLRSRDPSDHAEVVNAGPGRLSLVFGDGPTFSDIERSASGTVRRTVRVEIANTGGAELTGCRVLAEGVTPGREPPAAPLKNVPLHLEPFRLPAHDKRPLAVAFYDEALPDGSPAGHIVINMPEATFRDFFKVSAAKAQTVTLRAEAAEGMFTKATCRLSVEDGRLRLAKL